MLQGHKLDTIKEIIKGSSREELAWINGYLSGILSGEESVDTESQPANKTAQKITIAYGTETGNSKKLATEFATKAKRKGLLPKLVSLDQYRPTDLTKEKYFITIISTQGEGEPPLAAKKFYDHIHTNGFTVKGMKYGVLALGDTAYPLFCQAGEDVDKQLQKLGGQRIADLQKCDVDYDEVANNWFDALLHSLNETGNGTVTKSVHAVETKPTGKIIHKGKLLHKVLLNGRGSQKETYHLEIKAPGVTYQPGDSFGIVPVNHTREVEAILQLTGADRQQTLVFKNDTYTVFELLKNKLNISWLPLRVIKGYAAIVNTTIPGEKVSLWHLLKKFPPKDAGQFLEVISILEPITPRLYSIASSPVSHEGEIHLTVARDKFMQDDALQFGLCSSYLGELAVDNEIAFYIHPNKQFRLPGENADVIMIGPGTGIAPFRSFIAERDALGATGRNWLFFGDQHFTTDFLYQTEWQDWFSTGVLTNISLAFSRDQEQKIYVQHRMQQRAAELFEWLQNGAFVYICGAKEPMSVDVEKTLLNIISEQGKLSQCEALNYLDKLKTGGRYHLDVY